VRNYPAGDIGFSFQSNSHSPETAIAIQQIFDNHLTRTYGRLLSICSAIQAQLL